MTVASSTLLNIRGHVNISFTFTVFRVDGRMSRIGFETERKGTSYVQMLSWSPIIIRRDKNEGTIFSRVIRVYHAPTI